jgi:hypothetical protein
MSIKSFLKKHVFFNWLNCQYLKLSTLAISDEKFISNNHGKTLNNNLKIEKPLHLELMKSLAIKLSQDFNYVRCDFFEVGGQVYFGEFTFTLGAGIEKFTSASWDKVFGDYWDGKF